MNLSIDEFGFHQRNLAQLHGSNVKQFYYELI